MSRYTFLIDEPSAIDEFEVCSRVQVGTELDNGKVVVSKQVRQPAWLRVYWPTCWLVDVEMA